MRQTLIVFMLLSLAACGSTGGGADGAQSGPNQVTGVALPEGYSVDAGRTLILGDGDRWTGRLSYTIYSDANDMFDFYRRKMPPMGWSELSVVRGETSTLVFSSGSAGRIATVQIVPRTIMGSRVDVVVAPQAGGGTSAAAAPRNEPIQPSPLASTSPARVRTQPLSPP